MNKEQVDAFKWNKHDSFNKFVEIHFKQGYYEWLETVWSEAYSQGFIYAAEHNIIKNTEGKFVEAPR